MKFELLSERLTWLRKKTGRSSRQVALAAGIGVSYLNRIEKGNRENPSREKLKKLADHYGANFEWVETGIGEIYAPGELGRAKNELFELLGQLEKRESVSDPVEIILSNIGARLAQFKYSDQTRRIGYIKEIVDELTAYSHECEKEFPRIKKLLLKVARAKSQ